MDIVILGRLKTRLVSFIDEIYSCTSDVELSKDLIAARILINDQISPIIIMDKFIELLLPFELSGGFFRIQVLER